VAQQHAAEDAAARAGEEVKFSHGHTEPESTDRRGGARAALEKKTSDMGGRCLRARPMWCPSRTLSGQDGQPPQPTPCDFFLAAGRATGAARPWPRGP
jgi:hypothetical protein